MDVCKDLANVLQVSSPKTLQMFLRTTSVQLLTSLWPTDWLFMIM